MSFVVDRFSAHSGLSRAELLDPATTLGDVIERSPTMHNSIDLMEAFARSANALKKEHGLRIRLPSFPLDTPMLTVLAAFESQIAGGS
jgi:hypothetical protein